MISDVLPVLSRCGALRMGEQKEPAMTQNIVSLNLTDEDLTTIDEGLAVLEQKLAPLIGLSPRPTTFPLGNKSFRFAVRR